MTSSVATVRQSHLWDLLFDGRGVLASVSVHLVLDDGGRPHYLDSWFGHDPLPDELDSATRRLT